MAELLYLEKQGQSLPIEMLINSSGTTRQDGEIVSILRGLNIHTYAHRVVAARRQAAESRQKEAAIACLLHAQLLLGAFPPPQHCFTSVMPHTHSCQQQA